MDIIENEDCANNGSLTKKERNNYVGVSEVSQSVSQLRKPAAKLIECVFVDDGEH